jgi:hypothetical protein
MSEYSDLSKDAIKVLNEVWSEKDNNSIYIKENKNKVKNSVNTRITSVKSKIPPKNTKK